MSGRRGGCLTFLAFWFAGFGRLVILLATWTAIGLTNQRFGAAAAIAVALVAGVVGWWWMFVRLEPRLDRLAESLFGPRDEAVHRGLSAQLAWSQLSPWVKTWTRFLFAFAVVAPVLTLLLHLYFSRP